MHFLAAVVVLATVVRSMLNLFTRKECVPDIRRKFRTIFISFVELRHTVSA